MTSTRAVPTALKNLGALVAAFFASAVTSLVFGRAGLAVAGASADQFSVAAAFVVVMFFVVPAVAGVVLGLLSTHPVLLAIPLVVLSLSMTYLSLGPAGLPRGWKVFEYVIQTAVVAGVGALVAARRRRAVTPSGAG